MNTTGHSTVPHATQNKILAVVHHTAKIYVLYRASWYASNHDYPDTTLNASKWYHHIIPGQVQSSQIFDHHYVNVKDSHHIENSYFKTVLRAQYHFGGIITHIIRC